MLSVKNKLILFSLLSCSILSFANEDKARSNQSSVKSLQETEQQFEKFDKPGTYVFVLEGLPTERYPNGMKELGQRKVEKAPNGLNIYVEGKKEYKSQDGQLHIEAIKNVHHYFKSPEEEFKLIYVSSSGAHSTGTLVDLTDNSLTLETQGYSDLLGKNAKSKWVKTLTNDGYDVTVYYLVDGTWKELRKGNYRKVE
jgi:hypothetical protein